MSVCEAPGVCRGLLSGGGVLWWTGFVRLCLGCAGGRQNGCMNMSLASTTVSWCGGSMLRGRQELRDSAGMASKTPGIRVDMGDFNDFCCPGGLIWTPSRGDIHQSNVQRTRSAVLEGCLWTSEWVNEYVLGVHVGQLVWWFEVPWTPRATLLRGDGVQNTWNSSGYGRFQWFLLPGRPDMDANPRRYSSI